MSATVTDLGSLSASYATTFAAGINNAGQIVGWSLDASGVQTAFLWQNGSITSLAIPGEANAISADGEVVGFYLEGEGGRGGFIWQNGAISRNVGTLSPVWAINSADEVAGLGYPTYQATQAATVQNGKLVDLGNLGTTTGAVDSAALGLNSAGAVVGWSQLAEPGGFLLHGFLWQNGTLTDLGTLNGASGQSEATAINNEGQVVGWSSTAFSTTDDVFEHGFLWQNGQMTDLGALGEGASLANAINNTGQVVGWSISASGAEHAFLWQNGLMIDLNTLLAGNSGWTLVDATALNDNGQVIGEGIHNGVAAAFLLQLPTTLPSVTYAVTPAQEVVNQAAGTDLITITRSAASAAATVYLSTQDNSVNPVYAANGGAFQPLSDQPVTFAAGQLSAQVAVAINGIAPASAYDKNFGLMVTDGTSSAAHDLASSGFSVTAAPAANNGYSVASVALPSGSGFVPSADHLTDGGQAYWATADANNVEHVVAYAAGSFTTVSAPSGSGSISVTGIDAAGQLAGVYSLNGTGVDFLSNGSGVTPINPPAGSVWQMLGINAAGVISLIADQSGNFFLDHEQDGNWSQTQISSNSTAGLYIANGAGQVAWAEEDSFASFYGYIDSQGSITSYPIAYTYNQVIVNAISANGEVAATSYCPLIGGNSILGYVFSHGEVTTYDFPAGAIVPANEQQFINENGQVVGSYYDTGGHQTWYLYGNGSVRTIDPGGSATVSVVGLSAAGDVAGTYVAPTAGANGFAPTYGFIDSNGTILTIDPAGSSSVAVAGVNNAGLVAGDYVDANNKSQGFIYDNGAITEIDPTGAVNTTILGINDAGQVIGSYTDANGVSHAFVATPPAAAGVSVASAISAYTSGQLQAPVAVTDSAAQVQSNLDAIETLSAAGMITSITLTDSATPTLAISAAQANNDALALGQISGSYALIGSGATVIHNSTTQESLTAPIANSTVEGGGYDVLDLSRNPIASQSVAYSLTANGDGSLTLATAGSSDHVSGVIQLVFADKAITVAVKGSLDADVALLYQGALGRSPDAGGLAYWDAIANALPASAQALGPLALSDSAPIAAGFTGSAEFVSKYGTLTNAQYVTQLYANVLDRAPDSGGFAYWTSQLGAGVSRNDVLIGFADSAEAISNATQGFVGQSGSHAAWLFLT